MAYAGSYVAVAKAGSDLVGACAGFYGQIDQEWELHSHIAGVTSKARGRSVGFALKTHQRAWALHRGLDRISWTFDPLVRRNAYFNLSKLAARPRTYLQDFYGPMTDGINAGDETDRLVAEWRLLDESVARACAGRPEEPDIDALLASGAVVGLSADGAGRPVVGAVDALTVLVGVPADIEQMRAVDRPSALAWRRGLRQVWGGLLAEGAQVSGFARTGWYVVRRCRGEAGRGRAAADTDAAGSAISDVVRYIHRAGRAARARRRRRRRRLGECVADASPLYSPEYVDGCAEVLRRFLVPALARSADVTAAGVAPALAAFKGNQMAKAALETAVLDAELRSRDVSLGEYLGAVHERVPCGVSVGIMGSVPELLEAVSAYVWRRVTSG